MNRSDTVVEVIENFFKVLTRIDGTVGVEVFEVHIDDVVGEIAILGQPDINPRGFGDRRIEREGVGCSGRGWLAANRHASPLSGVARTVDLKLWESVGVDWQLLMIVIQLETRSDNSRYAKVLGESSIAGHVVPIGIGAFCRRNSAHDR